MQKLDCWRSFPEGISNQTELQTQLQELDSWKEFICGEISISSSGKIGASILCSVAIGVSFLADSIDSGDDKELEIPSGYDSVHYSKQTKEMLSYSHRYRISKADQILPKYAVLYEVKGKGAGGSGTGVGVGGKSDVCKVCELRPPTVYCIQDGASLCEKCDRDVHSANKLLREHQRVPLKDKEMFIQKSFGNCLQHVEIPVEFYCAACQIPVCVHCKMIGTHSSGQAASHKLTPIRDAYQTAFNNSSKVRLYFNEIIV
jgi:hypothetical protein